MGVYSRCWFGSKCGYYGQSVVLCKAVGKFAFETEKLMHSVYPIDTTNKRLSTVVVSGK